MYHIIISLKDVYSRPRTIVPIIMSCLISISFFKMQKLKNLVMTWNAKFSCVLTPKFISIFLLIRYRLFLSRLLQISASALSISLLTRFRSYLGGSFSFPLKFIKADVQRLTVFISASWTLHNQQRWCVSLYGIRFVWLRMKKHCNVFLMCTTTVGKYITECRY